MPDAPDPSVRDATLRKMDAEIAKLLAEARHVDDKADAETAKLRADTHRHDDKVGAEIAKLLAETSKLSAETYKLNTESRWYLLAVGSGFTLAIVALTRLGFQ